MAEGWFGGLVKSIKDKSFSTYEQVKKDLNEYSHTVKTDTYSAVNVTSDTLKVALQNENSKLKQGITSFMQDISGSNESRGISPSISGKLENDVVLNRTQARLYAIQLDPATYLETPIGGADQFEAWSQQFNIDDFKGHMSELLLSNAQMRRFYSHVVPKEISHGMFWKRYFYRLHQIEQDDARKKALMNRAEKSQEDSISWDDDGDESQVDLSSETYLPSEAIVKDVPITPNNCPEKSEDVHDVPLSTADTLISTDLPTTATCMINDSDFNVCSNSTPENNSIISQTPHMQTIETHDLPENPQSSSSEDKQINTINNSDSCVSAHPVDRTELLSNTTNTSVKESVDSIDIRTKEKGDMVVVGGSSSSSPASEATSSQCKESSEDWDEDIDLEVTEEDMKAAEEVAKKFSAAGIIVEEDGDEWSWD